MKRSLLAASLLWLALVPSATAETPESDANRLVAEGAALAQKGKLDDAIARFRAAERRYPRAIHDCNLGLAYSMGQHWPEAHALLARCTARATDALPAWVDVERRRVLGQLTRGAYTSVAITTEPPTTLTVDRLLPEDTFTAPATVWLAPGSYRLTIRADGFRPETRAVRVSGAGAQRLDVVLERAAVPGTAARLAELETPHGERGLPFVPAVAAPDLVPGIAVLTSGAVTLGVAALFHGLAVSSSDAIGGRVYATQADADGDLDTFRTQAGVAIGAYSVGTALVISGIALLIWPPDEAP